MKLVETIHSTKAPMQALKKPLRGPPGEPHDPEDAQRSSPPPDIPNTGRRSPAPADPEE